MVHNIGRFDRAVRLVIGVMLLGLFGAVPAPWRYLTLIGLVFLATAFTGFCPLYHLLGIHRPGPPQA